MKLPELTAQQITEKITNSSFEIFKDKKFREWVDFDELEQIEQDRIFNELVVSGLSLAILMFRTVRDLTSDEKRAYFHDLQMEMMSYYGNWLMELGAEKEFCNMWKELIQMRCKEYEEDFEEYKKELPDPRKGNPWISVVAFGGYRHIRRGKTDEKDPLFLFITRWVKELAILISKSAA